MAMGAPPGTMLCIPLIPCIFVHEDIWWRGAGSACRVARFGRDKQLNCMGGIKGALLLPCSAMTRWKEVRPDLQISQTYKANPLAEKKQINRIVRQNACIVYLEEF
jgi:hypothetical protein